jgi:hypothetical protein
MLAPQMYMCIRKAIGAVRRDDLLMKARLFLFFPDLKI